MKRLALLAILFFIVGCAQGPFATAPSQPEARAVGAAALPQPSAQVRDAQQQLSEIGLYAGPIDGLYGLETQRAVERFQRSQGLPMTARLDNATRIAIGNEAARAAEPVALSDPVLVRTVQNRLRQLDFYDGPADGVWGTGTQLGLERFQRTRGLAVGHVTRPTLLAMGLDAAAFPPRVAAGVDAREPLAPVVVSAIQRRLRQDGFYKGAVDGVWGPETQAALERFQRSRGLEASGGFNPMTAVALGLDPNNLSGSAEAIAEGRVRR